MPIFVQHLELVDLRRLKNEAKITNKYIELEHESLPIYKPLKDIIRLI